MAHRPGSATRAASTGTGTCLRRVTGMAGYEAGAYDKNYFWTTGAIWAQGSVDAAGVLYHLTGRTKATSDPFDRTGVPDILRGQRYARHGCGGM